MLNASAEWERERKGGRERSRGRAGPAMGDEGKRKAGGQERIDRMDGTEGVHAHKREGRGEAYVWMRALALAVAAESLAASGSRGRRGWRRRRLCARGAADGGGGWAVRVRCLWDSVCVRSFPPRNLARSPRPARVWRIGGAEGKDNRHASHGQVTMRSTRPPKQTRGPSASGGWLVALGLARVVLLDGQAVPLGLGMAGATEPCLVSRPGVNSLADGPLRARTDSAIALLTARSHLQISTSKTPESSSQSASPNPPSPSLSSQQRVPSLDRIHIHTICPH